MYLDTIVDYINNTVRTRMGRKASHSRFYGICKAVSKGDDKTIVYYDNDGNDINVQDDSYNLFCYHRFTGFSFQVNELNLNDSYGRGASTKTAFANFIMGVYGNRKGLQMTDQELAASICFNFPDVMERNLVNQLTGVQNVIISPVSTLNQETRYQPSTEPITPDAENIFFTVNYRISITGDVGCLSQCNPECI